MAFRRAFPTSVGLAQVVFTERDDGDFRPRADQLPTPAPLAVPDGLPRTWLRQVHGADVIEVGAPGQGSGLEGDALVTTRPGALLSVLGADCPLVALFSPDGVVAVAHAGWRGLVAGVLPATVAAMARLGAGQVTALLGPCISPEHYEFGPADLERVVAVLGPTVRGRTEHGRPALDLPAGVEASLRPLGVSVDRTAWRCTAAGAGQFSHRARGDRARHAALIWLEPNSSCGDVPAAGESSSHA